MTGETPNPLHVLREYLPPPTHDPPCGHGCCRIPAALAQVEALAEAAQTFCERLDAPEYLRAALVPFAAHKGESDD